MAQDYIICSGETPVTYSCDIALEPGWSCGFVCIIITNLNTTYHYVPYILTVDAPVHSPLTVTYRLTYTVNVYMDYELVVSSVRHENRTHYFTYGQDTYTIEYPSVEAFPCYKKVDHGGGDYNESTLDLVEVMPQVPIPNCVPPPPECSLSIDATSSTDPSQRGASDGTISANINTDGAPDWYINSVIDSGNLSGHTFTGLTTGTYYIKAVSGSCWDEEIVIVYEGEFRSGDFIAISPTLSGNTVAVENPILLTLSTALNSTSPDYSINTFTVTGTIANVVVNFALTFPYSYEAEFRSKGYPDRSNYFLESILKDQVGTTVGNNNAEEIATSLGESFQKDPILSRIYYISTSGSVVTMIAKEFGAVYNLSATNVMITGSNLILANVTPGMAEYDGQLTADYSLYAELFVNQVAEYGEAVLASDYKRVIELELPFSQDNIHKFDVAPTLKDFVLSSKIGFTITGVTYLSDMIASYYMRYGEKYPLVTNSNTKKKRYKGETEKGYCINSALNFEDANSMNAYFATSGCLFLNTAPDTKYSQRDAKEFYSFVIPKDYTYPLAVYGNIYNYDGSSTLNVKFFDITTAGSPYNFGGVAVLSLGYNDLGLSAYEASSKIRKVEFQVKQNDGGWISFTETKSYLLEIDEQPSNYNVAFLNKLGAYETYSFTGELQEVQEITRDLYQRPYSINSSGAATVGFQYNSTLNTEFTKTFIVNTGIISADVYYYLMGLLQSNKIYHYDDVHETYLNVVSQTAMKSTNANEYFVQVTFKETIQENAVSM